ncbi:MAG TPA: hypothetical protein VLA34_09180 [Candidatus Krumholzibacterium sp.]|nr:hypothetical protein [Candidatus Krumholzibacterium sp.]
MRNNGRSLGLITLVMAVLVLSCGDSLAEGGNFGLGIIIGEPTGITGKLFISERNAIDGALAWSLDENNYMHIQGDYLFHNFFVLEDVEGEFAWYAGLGGRIVLVDKADDHVGIRFPLGVTFLFDDGRFDTFMEIVPIMDVAPDTDFDMEGAIGIRFYF